MVFKWVVLLVALANLQIGCGLPVRPTPYTYPHVAEDSDWRGADGGAAYALPALALAVTAVSLLFGCTWCFRRKDCKSSQGAESQLFTASVSNLHDGTSRRSQPPDSGFVDVPAAAVAAAAAPHTDERNNNGPISLREMQNIANNNALAYIATEDEQALDRERAEARDSRIEFEPLPLPPVVIAPGDQFAPYSEWFRTSDENFSRSRLQYLHEISTSRCGRVVKGEIERADGGGVESVVAVKILDVNDASEKVHFLKEARVYRELKHENILKLLAYSVNEHPWLLLFEYCPMYLREFLLANRHKFVMLIRRSVPLRLMCDVGAGLSYMHSHGFVYGNLSIDTILIRDGSMRAVLGHYGDTSDAKRPDVQTTSADVWSLGQVLWEICSWEEAPEPGPPLPEPALPCLYREQLYHIMQVCWDFNIEDRPSAERIYILLNHLYNNSLQTQSEEVIERDEQHEPIVQDDGYSSNHFEERWENLKPNTIPTLDEHIAIVHAPSSSRASHFTASSDQDGEENAYALQTLSTDLDTAVSRSSSILSDKDPISVYIKSESLTNLHGSLEDVRNIYLIHSENAIPDDHEHNPALMEGKDNSDSSDINRVDPWLKDIISDSQDDVSYYRDVSDVIKNLDNILNSENTSSSESSHQASPSRDALRLDCKKDYTVQSSLVKSPGINNFQSILEATPEHRVNEDVTSDTTIDDEIEKESVGILNHSFERHSETNSQHTDETLSPDTPLDEKSKIDVDLQVETMIQDNTNMEDGLLKTNGQDRAKSTDNIVTIPNLRDLCIASVRISLSNVKNDCLNSQNEDCGVSCDKEDIVTPLVTNNNNFSFSKSVDNTSSESKDISDIFNKHVFKEDTLDVREIGDSTERDKQIKELNKVDTTVESDNIISSSVQQHSDTTANETLRHEMNREPNSNKQFISDDSTVYMDLTNETGNNILIKDTLDNNFESVIKKSNDVPGNDTDCLLVMKNDSTVYLDLPDIVQQTNNLLNNERRCTTEHNVIKHDFHSKEQFSSSTPKSSDELRTVSPMDETSVAKEPNANENTFKRLPSNQSADATLTKIDSKVMSENLSPFESPAKSNFTESYDENSFALGNLDYSSLESFMAVKGHIVDFIEIPREEQLAFSANYAEIDLETPSPLRDSNFLNEVPDIDLSEDTYSKNNVCTQNEKVCDLRTANNVESLQSSETSLSHEPLIIPAAHEHGFTLASTSDANPGLGSFQAEIMKFNLTTRLAMAENENNFNIEQSGPLNIEEYVSSDPVVPTDVNDDNEKDGKTENFNKTGPILEETVSTVPEEHSHEIQCDRCCIILNADDSKVSVSPIFLITEASVFKDLSEADSNVEEFERTSVSSPKNLIYRVPESLLANNGGIEHKTQDVMGLPSEADIIQDSCNDASTFVNETDTLPESILAGNMAVPEGDARLGLIIDDASVQALRNELELKLPIAQGTVDQFDQSDVWSGELPPPPELIVNYPGALSPIAEETRQQLSAYENHIQWEASENNKTDSSESYPEPCNDSTAEVTDLITAVISGQPDDHTYTIASDHTHRSANNTYTVQKDATTSKELTMSVDSLNVSGTKQLLNSCTPENDDKTFSVCKDDECEKLSQVSPYMLSSTTESSMPEPSENGPVSTLSKPTVPSDTKSSKPSEIQCLSKATSIDSWCSNDTLFNVEDNFDDLAMDSDVPLECDIETEIHHSNSTGTLTDHDGDKDSRCSTYIIHDSKSDSGENFTPDSITANLTYTKTKNVDGKTSPTHFNNSDANDSSAKNTPTKDLAYGTLISSCNSNMASNSNFTTEIFSAREDPWKICTQVEMVRQASNVEDLVNLTPPKATDVNEEDTSDRPKFISKPYVTKMDSFDITCLHDNVNNEYCNTYACEAPSVNYRFVNMGNSVTSTPIISETQSDSENVQPVFMVMPRDSASDNINITGLPNLHSFLHSAELRPQDMESPVVNATDDLLEPEEQILSGSNANTSKKALDTYSDFELSATFKPQGGSSHEANFLHSRSLSIGSDEFHQFENSVRSKPQDLSVPVQDSHKSDSKEILDEVEINRTGIARFEVVETNRSPSVIHENQSECVNGVQEVNCIVILENSSTSNLPNKLDIRNEVQDEVADLDKCSQHLQIITADNHTEEHEQPHSIIITETSDITAHRDVHLDNTYDSHAGRDVELNATYNSHSSRNKKSENEESPLQTVLSNGESHRIPDFVEGPQCINKLVDPELVKENGIDNGKLGIGLNSDNEMEANSSLACKVSNENYATVNFLKEPFEELSTCSLKNDSDIKNDCDLKEKTLPLEETEKFSLEGPSSEQLSNEDAISLENVSLNLVEKVQMECDNSSNEEIESVQAPVVTAVTEDFLENEKQFCQFSSYYLPLLSDLRFTGPGNDIMSTSFNQESGTGESPSEQTDEPKKPDGADDVLKEWDSDSDDTQSTNSSSGEFIWKQRANDEENEDGGEFDGGRHAPDSESRGAEPGGCDSGSGSGSGSGSEGDEVEFVPSSWDCLAAPAKSSLRSLEQAQADNKKRVVFKRQKYHCVYEYPREASDSEGTPALAALPPPPPPHYYTYADCETSNAEEWYELYARPLPAVPAYGPADYDDDFFISSSARPFESLCVLSSSSQFFPGMRLKGEQGSARARLPSLDFTTPDSGVEDVATPGSASGAPAAWPAPPAPAVWKAGDSASSSESASPSSPGSGEALGGLRHTRDRLKLDLPPSPLLPSPSPRHSRVFSFSAVEKPKRSAAESDRYAPPAPTFSTFGKRAVSETAGVDVDPALVLTDESERAASSDALPTAAAVTAASDSGDEDSGIESSAKPAPAPDPAPDPPPL